jgi:hypothetical protein
MVVSSLPPPDEKRSKAAINSGHSRLAFTGTHIARSLRQPSKFASSTMSGATDIGGARQIVLANEMDNDCE